MLFIISFVFVTFQRFQTVQLLRITRPFLHFNLTISFYEWFWCQHLISVNIFTHFTIRLKLKNIMHCKHRNNCKFIHNYLFYSLSLTQSLLHQLDQHIEARINVPQKPVKHYLLLFSLVLFSSFYIIFFLNVLTTPFSGGSPLPNVDVTTSNNASCSIDVIS